MRTTVNVDSDLVDSARRTLKTQGLSETINAALADVSRRAKLKSFDVLEFDVKDEDIASARANRLSSAKNRS